MAGLEYGDDRQLAPLQPALAWMPLEQAEDLAMQEHGVERFEELCTTTETQQRIYLHGFRLRPQSLAGDRAGWVFSAGQGTIGMRQHQS